MDIFGKNRENTMKLKLLSFAFLAFLFAACGDDSSSSADNSASPEESSASTGLNVPLDEFSCVVKTGDNRVRQTIVVPGEFYGYSEMIVNGSKARAVVKNYYIGRSEAEIAEVCEELEDQSDDYDSGSFMCNKDSSKFTITIPKAYASPLDEVKEEMKEECRDYEEDWKEKQAKLSSSSKPTSSAVKSSSSSNASSSSVVSRSSSSVASSSSFEKVVCTEREQVVVDTPFVVAYEFSDPENLGKDYFGTIDAMVGKGSPRGDCKNMILDGTSGLEIPLAPVFKSKGFVVEARVYPTAFNTMQNILVSEPPGSSFSGWQLRLDNGEVTFHLRDYSRSYSTWKVFKAGKIALNEWAVIRAERYPSGKVIVQVNGETVVEDEYIGNVVNEVYNLGLGYDAMNQDRSSERYFVGKMDYVRFGMIMGEEVEDTIPPAEARLIEDETTGRMKVAALDETLVCSEQDPDTTYRDFAVAYEFDDVNDLGFDAVGDNHANFGVGAPDGDCSTLILDGASGLKIPLSDDFKSKGIDVDVRFMLTDVSETSVIFGSSPESAGGDGWRISVRNGKVYFDAMDYDIGDEWASLELVGIEANQWIETRVKIFPAKSELDGVIFYSLNVRIDGGLRMATEFKGDLSHLTSDLAIGYNPLNGGSEFANGKIDFVRFKALSEEGL